jgi:hypothetical protein
MTSTKSSPRTSKVAIITAAVLVAGVAVFYITHIRGPKEGGGPEIAVHRAMPQYPEPILRTRPVPKAARNHLLDGDFNIMKHMQAIPENRMSIFISAFVEIDGSPAERSRVQFADSGQPIQASDSVVQGLPFRRLIFAGLGEQRAFIYYEHGGGVPHSYCLAVLDVGSGSVVWVGEARKEARNLSDLRSMVSDGLFDDSPGPGC